MYLCISCMYESYNAPVLLKIAQLVAPVSPINIPTQNVFCFLIYTLSTASCHMWMVPQHCWGCRFTTTYYSHHQYGDCSDGGTLAVSRRIVRRYCVSSRGKVVIMLWVCQKNIITPDEMTVNARYFGSIWNLWTFVNNAGCMYRWRFALLLAASLLLFFAQALYSPRTCEVGFAAFYVLIQCTRYGTHDVGCVALDVLYAMQECLRMWWERTHELRRWVQLKLDGIGTKTSPSGQYRSPNFDSDCDLESG